MPLLNQLLPPTLHFSEAIVLVDISMGPDENMLSLIKMMVFMASKHFTQMLGTL